MQLLELAVGERARIVSLKQCDKLYRHKLLAMGLTQGVEFTLTRKAPLGDPIELSVRGFALSVRKAETTGLVIERL